MPYGVKFIVGITWKICCVYAMQYRVVYLWTMTWQRVVSLIWMSGQITISITSWITIIVNCYWLFCIMCGMWRISHLSVAQWLLVAYGDLWSSYIIIPYSHINEEKSHIIHHIAPNIYLQCLLQNKRGLQCQTSWRLEYAYSNLQDARISWV